MTADPAGEDNVAHPGTDPDRAGAHGPDAAVPVHGRHAVVLGGPEDLRPLGDVADAEAIALAHAEEADVGLVQSGLVLGGRRVELAADPAGELRAGELGIDPCRAGANGGDAAGLVDGGDLLVLGAPEDLIVSRRAGDGQHKGLASAEEADVRPVQRRGPAGGKGLGGGLGLGLRGRLGLLYRGGGFRGQGRFRGGGGLRCRGGLGLGAVGFRVASAAGQHRKGQQRKDEQKRRDQQTGCAG